MKGRSQGCSSMEAGQTCAHENREKEPFLSAVLYPSPDGAGAGASEARVTGGRGGEGRSLSSPQMGPPVPVLRVGPRKGWHGGHLEAPSFSRAPKAWLHPSTGTSAGGLLNISGLMGIPFPDLPQNGPWTNYFVTLEMVPSGPPTTSLRSCGTLPPKTKPNEQKHRITP